MILPMSKALMNGEMRTGDSVDLHTDMCTLPGLVLLTGDGFFPFDYCSYACSCLQSSDV